MTSLADRSAAARLAWAALKLSRVGRHPVAVGRLAAAVGLDPADARRLAGMIGFTVKDDLVRVDATPGTASGLMRGGAVGPFLLAIATGERVHTRDTCPVTGAHIRVELTPERVLLVDPPAAVIAITDMNLDFDRQESLYFASADAAAGWAARNPRSRVYPVTEYLAHARHLVASLESRH